MLIYNTVFPFLLILILGFLTSGDYSDSGIDSYDYYGVSMLLFSALYVSMTAANSFMEKGLKASNLRVIYSPVRKSSIYLAKIAATCIFTSVCFLSLIAVCRLVLGVNFGGENMGYIIALLLLFDLISSTLGVTFCCIFKSEELANRILGLVNNIFAVLGGVFFSLASLGSTAEKLSYISPLKWILQAVFKIVYDHDLSNFLPLVIILPALTLVLLVICQLTFKTEDYV